MHANEIVVVCKTELRSKDRRLRPLFASYASGTHLLSLQAAARAQIRICNYFFKYRGRSFRWVQVNGLKPSFKKLNRSAGRLKKNRGSGPKIRLSPKTPLFSQIPSIWRAPDRRLSDDRSPVRPQLPLFSLRGADPAFTGTSGAIHPALSRRTSEPRLFLFRNRHSKATIALILSLLKCPFPP